MRFIFLLLAFTAPGSPISAQNEQVSSKSEIVKTDTVYSADTIYVKEIITRTDVIERTTAIARKVRSDSLKKEDIIDLNEKVLFRGDTINMILKDRNLGRQRFDRGLFNWLFIPKGIWQVGLTASYGEFSTADLQILDLVSDIDFKGHIFSIRPYFAYFVRSNISVGMRLGYTSGRASIGSFNMEIDEDMSFNLHDIMYKSESYSAALTFSQYLGIARRGRFGVFNEVELAFSSGSSDFH
ncbi:MAG: hypothetical protein J1E78_02005, partial [Muribaculaceae bacterium]|nr:hypothetical protein [Muribaculaceae bacterium]